MGIALLQFGFLINADQFHGHQVRELMHGEHQEVHTLQGQQQNINLDHLKVALTTTANKRNSLGLMKQYQNTMSVVRGSGFMLEQWQKYQHSFDYAKEISLKETCDSVIEVMNRLEL